MIARRSSCEAGTTVWILINLTLVVLTILLYFKRDVVFPNRRFEFAPHPGATALPASQPTAADAAPTPIDLRALPPADWPDEVTLSQQTEFVVVTSGHATGKIMVPAHSLVTVRKFDGKNIEVGFRDAVQVVPVEATDFEDRAGQSGIRK